MREKLKGHSPDVLRETSEVISKPTSLNLEMMPIVRTPSLEVFPSVALPKPASEPKALPFETLEIDPNEIVYLNIGGYHYTTTTGTLIQRGSSYFTALFSGKYKRMLDKNGAVFIDRDGQYFAPLLEWLRTGEVSLPAGMEIRAIIREARFFSIDFPLLEDLNDNLSFITDNWLKERVSSHILGKKGSIVTALLKEVLLLFKKQAEEGQRVLRSSVYVDKLELENVITSLEAIKARKHHRRFCERYADAHHIPEYHPPDFSREVKKEVDKLTETAVFNSPYYKFLASEAEATWLIDYCKLNRLTIALEKKRIESIPYGVQIIHTV